MGSVATGFGQGKEALCHYKGLILLYHDRELKKLCHDIKSLIGIGTAVWCRDTAFWCRKRAGLAGDVTT